VLIHDPVGAFTAHVRDGLLKLSQHILGANSIVQGALPTMLAKTDQSFFDNVMTHLEVG
jgi:tyrosine aminotransferase